MLRINLKNVLVKNAEVNTLLSLLITKLGAAVYGEDDKGNLLFGIYSEVISHEEPIKLGEEIIGWVKGNDKASLIASLVNILVQKEADKKKIGSEILMLYQEVNLIFNFSQKLAQTIGQNSIAEITLDEAMRLIKSDNGLIILWDEKSNQLEVLASSGKFFSKEKVKSNVDLLLHLSQSGQSEIVGDVAALKEAGLIMPEVQSLIYAALKVKHRVMGAIVLANTADVQYAAADLKFLITLALQASSAIESAILYERNIHEAKEKEEAMRRIYEITNKFVPHEFIKSLGRKVITDIQLGDQVEKIVTVLFADIRDFTTLSEKMTPEENFSFVSSFNEKMGPVIRQYNGFINQYLGDAIMAIFPGNASDALHAAIKMQKAVREFNVSRVLKKKPPIKIGIGLHTGPLIMGITGDKHRMDATTISDTVNTASRLETLTKYYKGDILLSEDSLKNMNESHSFHLRHLGMSQLKGKTKQIAVYECFDGSDDNNIQKKLSSLSLFNNAMSDYVNKSFSEAAIKFNQVLEIHPDDLTTKLFLGNAHHYMSNSVLGSGAANE